MNRHHAPAAGLGRYHPGRLAVLLLLLGLLLAAVAALSALFGGVAIDLRRALFSQGSDRAILWDLRVPRIAVAALVGAALCASGAALQALFRNPLADPFVLGVSGGAALGVTAALVLEDVLRVHLGLSPPLLGFLGALLTTGFVRLVARRGGGWAPAAALLAGAVLNAVSGAVVLLGQLAVAPERAQQVMLWMSGSIGYPPNETLAWAAVAIGLGCGTLCWLAGKLRLMALGSDEAAQLGVDVERTQNLALAAASLAVAAAVALAGLIGFIGLLVPHLLRLWLGPDQRLVLPCAVLFGAAFLVATDALARLAFLPLGIEPPAGAVQALLGGPVFLWLLYRDLAGHSAGGAPL